jgi:hypothetical protein
VFNKQTFTWRIDFNPSEKHRYMCNVRKPTDIKLHTIHMNRENGSSLSHGNLPSTPRNNVGSFFIEFPLILFSKQGSSSACYLFHADFLFVLFFSSEDGGKMFLRNVS